MYCHNCGKEIENDSNVCGYCGAAVKNPTGSGQWNQNHPNYNQPGNQGQPNYNQPGNQGRPNYNQPGNPGRPNYNQPGNPGFIGNVNGGKMRLDFSRLAPYYQGEFQKIYNSGEKYKGKFNVWAFLFGFIWALTKECWLSVVICLVVSILTMGIGGIAYWFIYGFRGTYMYYRAYVKGKQCII